MKNKFLIISILISFYSYSQNPLISEDSFKQKEWVDRIYNNLSLDENNSNATGCSIDKLMSFIKMLEKEYGLRLLDRFDISYRKGSDIIIDRLNDFKKKVLTKEVNENTIVFNNLIKFKKDMTQNWELCAKDSWHQQLFK